MHSPEATLYCPNPSCQAPNPESHRFCQQCRALLPKIYLWAIAQPGTSYQPGQFLAGRYWCKQGQIFVDTKPGLSPSTSNQVPEAAAVYLRLIPFQLHVPQVYDLVASAPGAIEDIFLLDSAPLFLPNTVQNADSGVSVELMPALETVWQQASGLRQLNWLWQIAHLWEPLKQEGAASSLLTSSLMRVEGSLVRLLELHPDAVSPTLADLGYCWQQWQPAAQAEIADFLSALCQQMLQGQFINADQVIAVLDRALATCGQQQTRQLHLATQTDQGPTRQRNEDACYPPEGSSLVVLLPAASAVQASTLPLVIVCDGIGGHEGGNIASNLAIATLQQRLQFVADHTLPPPELLQELEQAALEANDAIARRNDGEQRQERQRMGTTLVMAVGQNHELYITNVGDSRAYRITRTGCRQVTLDDDLATREVRLGYALYRDALQQASAGSLVQALGMNASAFLHPTTQRFVLDEDCLFLLCSDGLSDNDRVEEHWQTRLLPVLEGTVDLATASKQLVAIANQENGHDNVTVALVLCRVIEGQQGVSISTSEAIAPLSTTLAEAPESSMPTPLRDPDGEKLPPTLLKTQDLKPLPRSRFTPASILQGLVLILGVGGLLTYLLIAGISRLTTAGTPEPIASSPSPPPSTTPSLPPVAPVPLEVQSRIQVTRSATADEQTAIALLPQPGLALEPGSKPFSVPVNSVLEIVGKQTQADQTWLQLKICSLPEATAVTRGATPAAAIARPGESGWALQDAIAPLVSSNLSLTKAQLGKCAEERSSKK